MGRMEAPQAPSRRLASIDAYRGFVMFLMMAEVLHLCAVAANFEDSPLWKLLCHHQSHVEWVGCSLHDLIQPSFSFLVGFGYLVATMPREREDPYDDGARL